MHEDTQIRIPYIPLQTSWEEYLSKRSSRYRRNIRNRSRKLKKLGKSNFLHIISFEESHIPHSQIMEWIRTIAESSWKAKADTDISSGPNVFNFDSELAEKLNKEGKLDLSILFVNERPIAYILGAIYNWDYLKIDIDFDKEFSNVSQACY